MGVQLRITGAAVALTLLAQAASAQDEPQGNKVILPPIDVSSSRLGTGIVGASTTTITKDDIESSPQLSIPDLLAREAGIQIQSLYGTTGGAGTTVDMRGFGQTAASNTLILVNGRRLNDWDLAGVDWGVIARESIERIEITRGNSGAVLYGDGAVGGVINIVTKNGVNQPNSARIESAFGSFRHAEGNASVNASSGPFAVSLFGDDKSDDGYRRNNVLRQQTGMADFRYTGDQGTAFATINADQQHLGLPGGRFITLAGNELVSDPRGTSTPFDYGNKQSVSLTVGVTRMLSPGVELIVDGSVRQKKVQSGFFDSQAVPGTYVDTVLGTQSLTPRLNVTSDMFGLPSKVLTGIDVYHTGYDSDRSAAQGSPPVHRYDIAQWTVGGYWQQTVGVRPDTDLSYGGRLQWNSVTAHDQFDPTAPGSLFAAPQGLPFDGREIQHALHLGFEHRFNDTIAVFGRAGRSFRVPNVDERVGQAPFTFPVLTPTTFDLRTQTSYDLEGGLRLKGGRWSVQASYFDMHLKNELHLDPVTLADINLDPTHRYGLETIGNLQVSDAVRLKGTLTYTRAVFVQGPFTGNDVPLVSRWTSSAAAIWDIIPKTLTFDTTVRYGSSRWIDGDEANSATYKLPAYVVVDLRLGGEVDRFFWSASVQNLFDRQLVDYAVIFAPNFYSAYPLPGRTVMFKAGVKY